MPKRHPIRLIDTPYRPDPGSFCRPKGEINGRHQIGPWYTCREVWHRHMNRIPMFFYSHQTGKSMAVSEFIARFEERLGIENKTHIGPTQRKTICWVEPSVWWTGKVMRRSLFTILLRVAQKYKIESDNFEEALYSHRYTAESRYAVERFLAGHTTYTGRKYGWYKQFCSKKTTDAEVDLLLTS